MEKQESGRLGGERQGQAVRHRPLHKASLRPAHGGTRQLARSGLGRAPQRFVELKGGRAKHSCIMTQNEAWTTAIIDV